MAALKGDGKVLVEQGSRDAHWFEIRDALVTGEMTYAEASVHFNEKEMTIRKRSQRGGWPVPNRIANKVRAIVSNRVQGEKTALATANIAVEKIEKHKRTVFELASGSLAKMKPRSPANFREANVADLMARRAAGIQDDQAPGLLLQLNEINQFDPGQAPREAHVIDAEVIPGSIAAGQPIALEQGSRDAGEQAAAAD